MISANYVDGLELRIRELTAERDAALAREAELVAQVENLRYVARELSGCIDEYEGLEEKSLRNAMFDFNRRLQVRIPATPTQCLRDIQAEAGRAGFLEGVRQMAENEIGWFGNDADSCANHYALRVKAGYE